jgi:formylglycine-generating enzyme required for sulfatase activity
VSNRFNETAAIQPAGYSQIRVREPAGERSFGETLSIGAEGADVVVPGAGTDALIIERHDAQWLASSPSSANVRINGRPFASSRELRRHDVLTVGDAHVQVVDASRTLLRIDVRHLVGNETIAPMTEVAALAGDLDDDDLEIRVSAPLQLVQPTLVSTSEGVAASRREMPPPARPAALKWAIGIAIAVALLSLLWVFSSLESIKLDVRPADAKVRMPGTWISMRVDQQMRVLPGTHVVRAEREGYVAGQVSVDVRDDAEPTARIRLAKLPGRLNIDTHGVAATVSVDGKEVGRAPGEVQVPAGQRTVTLRAPRYLDFVTRLEIEGADEEQDLNATLQPAWGTVKVSASPASARVSIDDQDMGAVPVSLEVASGVRKVQIAAAGFKAWQSSVVVKAGETLNVGPVTLGQPDARASIRSTPTGAEVTVDGSFRGRTPVVVELPSGVTHEIVASFHGHETWTRKVLAEPAKAIELDARLTPVLGAVTFKGEPAGAELVVDGAVRGQTPLSVNLTAEEHRIEVRKAEYLTFDTTITPAKGLDRSFEYKLTPADRAAALLASAPTVKTKDGYVLKLIPVGTFLMGSDRREQGRRPNEPQRKVTLKRPFYIGVDEVTNEDFRRFRPGHASGYIGTLSLDLDKQAVSQVSWNDAVEYCNWLSEREGLPAAYEKRGEDKYVLKTPVTIGYRLPTEAEWEYAARRTSAGKTVRFPWGDALPVAPDTGNLAGSEAGKIVEGELPGYQDTYVVVAPVGKFTPNALGLHDIGGNVSEWTNDFYLSFVDTRDSVDPLGPDQAGKHVIRGANWRSSAVSELRLAWRDSGEEPSATVGFRVARYAE